MKKNLLLSICILAFFACKKENPKPIQTQESEVDYREKYIGEYTCNGYYRVYTDSNTTYTVDTFGIIYNVTLSGDSSIILEGRTLKIEKDGYFGTRNYNWKFQNPPHGEFNDSAMYYTKDFEEMGTSIFDGFKRLSVSGLKKK